MKTHWFPVLLLISFAAGCAHSPDPAVASAPETAPLAAKQQTVLVPAAPSVSTSPKTSIAPETQPSDEFGDITDFEDFEDGQEEKKASIADPLEPFNRSMYYFNDKLYFWVLKPVAQGYSQVVPEPARIGVDNFFKNLGFPIRFVNCALQLNFAGAEKELGRFLVNTLFGFAGFRPDPGLLWNRSGILYQLADLRLLQSARHAGAGGRFVPPPILLREPLVCGCRGQSL